MFFYFVSTILLSLLLFSRSPTKLLLSVSVGQEPKVFIMKHLGKVKKTKKEKKQGPQTFCFELKWAGVFTHYWPTRKNEVASSATKRNINPRAGVTCPKPAPYPEPSDTQLRAKREVITSAEYL